MTLLRCGMFILPSCLFLLSPVFGTGVVLKMPVVVIRENREIEPVHLPVHDKTQGRVHAFRGAEGLDSHEVSWKEH